MFNVFLTTDWCDANTWKKLMFDLKDVLITAYVTYCSLYYWIRVRWTHWQDVCCTTSLMSVLFCTCTQHSEQGHMQKWRSLQASGVLLQSVYLCSSLLMHCLFTIQAVSLRVRKSINTVCVPNHMLMHLHLVFRMHKCVLNDSTEKHSALSFLS